MGRHKKNELRVEQYTKWIKSEKSLASWQALTFPAREAYMHFRLLCFAETAQKKPKVINNNGQVYCSSRRLAKLMGCSKDTAMRAVADLQAKGWLVCTQMYSRGVEGKGETASFRLTMMPMGSGNTFKPATREPISWTAGNDFDVVAYSKYKPKPRGKRINNIRK